MNNYSRDFSSKAIVSLRSSNFSASIAADIASAIAISVLSMVVSTNFKHAKAWGSAHSTLLLTISRVFSSEKFAILSFREA